MTTVEHLVPETNVLAIASHVVSGYVGNKIAAFVLQSLGCDVAALNTVQFSNHTGYRQWKGSKTTPEEITSLYEGLKKSHLAEFDMMLSGYIPGATAVEAVGHIARELNEKALPGRFFWVMDPVMGDNGSLYVAPDVVPEYRTLLHSADLILPNQFEAELLSETKITDLDSLTTAIQNLHDRYAVPHVVITSVSIPHLDHEPSTLSVVGSTMTSDRKARPFKIVFPAIDAYFSGTGDMFAALMVVRMREAVCAAPDAETLTKTASWISPDDVQPLDLPVARAAEKVLGSMHEVLTKTREAMVRELESKTEVMNGEMDDMMMHLIKSKAAELRLVRNPNCLRQPGTQFKARKM
ncbi:putative pyridoxal kinase C6F6.11c [Zalerion maritima]|uniref:pyridoxal kinase n=1 Tax=Zalerion maritima TaxID=339359 RepID=A0AAD5WR80_9PEZI|nr:putative pyridoxal kinase C6F6.11c [Zalerion maritima]